MQIKIVSTTDEFFELKEDWENLQEQDEDVTYYSTFEYNWTWWDVYRNDINKKLFILVVESNGTVIGIAPLIIEKVNKKIASYRSLRFLGKGDYLGIIIERTSNVKYGNIIKEIFNFIESKNQCFERIILTHIKNNSRLSAYILRNSQYNKSFTYLIECPILKYEKFNSYDVYKNEFITSNDKRYTNRLQREVGYNFKVVFNNKEEVYEKISELHIREQNYLLKNKGRKERKSLFNDKFFSKFIKKLYNNNSNVITFKIEDLNGDLLIYNTCYLYKRVLHAWNLAYNPKYEKYHLGKIINLEMIKYSFENNIADILDFGAGRYPWKFEWTDDFIFNYQLDMWNKKNIKGKLLKKYMILRKIKLIWR